MQAVDSKVDGWNTYILTLIIYLTLVFTLIPTRPSTLKPLPFLLLFPAKRCRDQQCESSQSAE